MTQPPHGLPPPPQRSPQLLALACIALANAIVAKVWHDGLPHRGDCPDPQCGHAVWLRNCGELMPHAAALIWWRRAATFGLPHVNRRTERGLIARGLLEDTLEWGEEQMTGFENMHTTYAQLRRLAAALGVATAATSYAQVRDWTAGLLGQITGRRPTVATSGGVAVYDRATLLVELRRRLARAHQLAQTARTARLKAPPAWAQYLRTFGPDHAARIVEGHKQLVAAYDWLRRDADALAAPPGGTLDGDRMRLILAEQHLDLLFGLIEPVAVGYGIHLVREDG